MSNVRHDNTISGDSIRRESIRRVQPIDFARSAPDGRVKTVKRQKSLCHATMEHTSQRCVGRPYLLGIYLWPNSLRFSERTSLYR